MRVHELDFDRMEADVIQQIEKTMRGVTPFVEETVVMLVAPNRLRP